jgi:ankyrin repeat protein
MNLNDVQLRNFQIYGSSHQEAFRQGATIDSSNISTLTKNIYVWLGACACNSLEVIYGLMDRFNYDHNEKDNTGRNGFHYACRGNSLEVIDGLMERFNYNPHEKANYGRNGFHYACLGNSLQVIDGLISRFNYDHNEKDNNRTNGFHYACRGNSLEVIDGLISRFNYDHNEKDNNRTNGFHYACRGNSLEVIYGLMERFNYDHNEKDNNGRNGFHYTCWENSLEVIDGLMERFNYDPREKDNIGRNGFHYACWGNSLEVIDGLMDRFNYDHNEKNNNGTNGFNYACWRNNLEVIDGLMERFNYNALEGLKHIQSKNKTAYIILMMKKNKLEYKEEYFNNITDPYYVTDNILQIENCPLEKFNSIANMLNINQKLEIVEKLLNETTYRLLPLNNNELLDIDLDRLHNVVNKFDLSNIVFNHQPQLRRRDPLFKIENTVYYGNLEVVLDNVEMFNIMKSSGMRESEELIKLNFESDVVINLYIDMCHDYNISSLVDQLTFEEKLELLEMLNMYPIKCYSLLEINYNMCITTNVEEWDYVKGRYMMNVDS